MLAKIVIVIEIQIIFPLFSSFPTIFIISSLAMVGITVAGQVASPEQNVKTLRTIAPIRISVIATNTDGYDKTELTTFIVSRIN